MAILIWLLGLADIYLTNIGLKMGVITEGNPVMAYLFAHNPSLAITFSLGTSAFFLFCLHRWRSRTTLAGKALWGLLVVRMFVILLHANWLIRSSLLDY
jgi:hypothetical protein